MTTQIDIGYRDTQTHPQPLAGTASGFYHQPPLRYRPGRRVNEYSFEGKRPLKCYEFYNTVLHVKSSKKKEKSERVRRIRCLSLFLCQNCKNKMALIFLQFLFFYLDR